MSWLRLGSTSQPAQDGFRVPRCAELTRPSATRPIWWGSSAELLVSLDSPLDLAPRGQLEGYPYQRILEGRLSLHHDVNEQAADGDSALIVCLCLGYNCSTQPLASVSSGRAGRYILAGMGGKRACLPH
jgi:hypothetical protein